MLTDINKTSRENALEDRGGRHKLLGVGIHPMPAGLGANTYAHERVLAETVLEGVLS